MFRSHAMASRAGKPRTRIRYAPTSVPVRPSPACPGTHTHTFAHAQERARARARALVCSQFSSRSRTRTQHEAPARALRCRPRLAGRAAADSAAGCTPPPIPPPPPSLPTGAPPCRGGPTRHPRPAKGPPPRSQLSPGRRQRTHHSRTAGRGGAEGRGRGTRKGVGGSPSKGGDVLLPWCVCERACVWGGGYRDMSRVDLACRLRACDYCEDGVRVGWYHSVLEADNLAWGDSLLPYYYVWGGWGG